MVILMKKNLLWLLLPAAFLGAVFVLLSSGGQNFLADNGYCGCGLPSPEADGEFDPLAGQAIFNNKPVLAMEELESSEGPLAQAGSILGVTGDERWVEIDLSEQRLYAREGDRIVYNFLISTGKPWTPTPKGEFRIWTKLKYSKMSGGRGASYYYLPNVPFIQYFYGSYGLHGTYWHSNFGQTMSHGCVNLATPDAEVLFYWTSPPASGGNVTYPSKDHPGTRVVVHG